MTFKQLKELKKHSRDYWDIIRGWDDDELLKTCKNILKESRGLYYWLGKKQLNRYLVLTQKPLVADCKVDELTGLDMANFKLVRIGYQVSVRFKDGEYIFDRRNTNPSDKLVEDLAKSIFPSVRKIEITRI